MQITDLNEKLKDEFGEVVKMPRFFGGFETVLMFNAEDHEKVFRNDGILTHRYFLFNIIKIMNFQVNFL